MGKSISQPSGARLVLAALGTFLLMCASAIVSNSTSYFVTSVTEAINVTRAEFSLYYSIISVGTAVASFPCGFIIAKIGYRKGFLIASFGVAIGFFIMSQLNTLWMVYAGAVFIGVFQVFITVPVVAVVNSWFPKKFNGLVMGLTMAGTGGGGIILAQIMPRVVAYVDWRTGYLICAIGYIVVTLIGNALCGGKPPEYEEDALTEKAEKEQKADVKKDASYVKNIASAAFILFCAALALRCIFAVFNQHYSAHLEDNFTTEQIALAMTVFNVVLLFMKTGMGALYDKVGYKVMLVLIFLSSLGYLGWTSSNLMVVLVATVPVMFACSTETVAFPLFLSEMYGKKFSSAAWGICWGCLYAGNAVGATVWGWIYDTFGTYNVGLRMEPVAMAIVCILVFVCVQLAKRRMAATQALKQ